MGLRKLHVFRDLFGIEAIFCLHFDTIFRPKLPEACRKRVTISVMSSFHTIYWYRRNSGGHNPRTGSILGWAMIIHLLRKIN